MLDFNKNMLFAGRYYRITEKLSNQAVAPMESRAGNPPAGPHTGVHGHSHKVKKMITQKEIKDKYHYDGNTGIFTLRNDIIAGVAIRYKKGKVVGSKLKNGYIYIYVDGKPTLAHRMAWLYEYGYLPENNIDHINRIRNDNRIANLREVSTSCNARNCKQRDNYTSGVKGVHFFSQTKRWHAYVSVNRRRIHIGYFSTVEEAVCNRLAFEQCLGWIGCESTSPALIFVQEMTAKPHFQAVSSLLDPPSTTE
jgi:hypothetical protein